MKQIAQFIKRVKIHSPNIFWSNFSQGLVALFGLLLSVAFTRFGNRELYGQYLFVMAILGLYSIVSIPGTRTVIFRTIAQGFDKTYRKATSFSFLWSLIGIPALIITGAFFWVLEDRTSGVCLIICGLAFPFMTSLLNWMQFLKGKSAFRKLAVYNLIKLSIALIAVTASILFTKNIIIILLAYFLVHSCFNIFYHFEALRSLRNDKLDPGWRRQSYALTIMELSSLVYGRVDIILIAALLPIDQLAIYGLAIRPGRSFLMMIKSTVEAILPKLFKSQEISVGYFYKYFLLSFLIPIILYPLVKPLILLLYGREYLELVVFSQVYFFIIPFYFLHSLAMNFMVKYKLNKEINFSKVTAILAIILLYVTLIPLYGVWGGIISSMLYFIIQLAINMFILIIRKSNLQTAQ